MLVKELIAKADINKQVELICSHQPSYEMPYDTNRVYDVQKQFYETLQSIEPIESNDSIIIFERLWDTDLDNGLVEYISGELHHKDELLSFLEEIKDKDITVDSFSENESEDILREKCNKFFDMPICYAYEFCDWAEILGWDIYEGNLDEFDLQECIYAILFEMSFNGIDFESQAERRAELDEAVKESEEIHKLPKEEQDKHYISFDEVKERRKNEFGWEEPSEEERAKNRQLMWLSSIKTLTWRFNNYKKMVGNYYEL